MKRLTSKGFKLGKDNSDLLPSYESIYYRLSAIEDILGDEYDLDRLRELKQADDEGRCVVLPLKPGDTIYTTRWFDKVWETCTDSKGKPFKRERFQHKVVKEKFSPFHLDYTEFGKSVFKTREEADAALRREQDKKGGSSE